MSRPETRSLDDLLAMHDLVPLAWNAALRAGAFLRDERPDDLVIDTKSTPSDVVSAMDRDAEAMILADLLGARPSDGLLGEEGGERPGTSGVRWVVDPLDGTVNYLHGLPMWGVSIAAEVAGRAEVGVVDVPEFAESYLAVRGQGAWLVRDGVGERLTGSECPTLAAAIVATGFGYAAERRRRQAEVVTGLITQVSDVRRMGAAVVDFCWLARGRVDAYYETGLNPWDMAAGGLIAAEAGAVVTGLRDDDTGVTFVAAAPGIAVDLRAALVALRADEV
jgi:myo-inositol-1(or 4)-monophosphatase